MCWNNVGERKLLGLETLQIAEEKVKLIRKRLKTAQRWQKSYTDKHRSNLEFQVGDLVFLRISPIKGSVRFGKCGKLNPPYIGPFGIMD